MAKSMSAGFAPVGAVMTTKEIADTMPLFRHVHTFGGHATCCAAANKVIEIKQRDGLIDKAKTWESNLELTLRPHCWSTPLWVMFVVWVSGMRLISPVIK